MDLSAPHITYILAAYAASAFGLVALVFRHVVTARRLKNALAQKSIADPGYGLLVER